MQSQLMGPATPLPGSSSLLPPYPTRVPSVAGGGGIAHVGYSDILNHLSSAAYFLMPASQSLTL